MFSSNNKNDLDKQTGHGRNLKSQDVCVAKSKLRSRPLSRAICKNSRGH